MPRGYGGYEKDNFLAYSDERAETPEAKKARKEAEVEEEREIAREEGAIRRIKLAEIVISREEIVREEAHLVTEDDVDHVHGEEEYDHQFKCCKGHYVDFDLAHGRAQLRFIFKGLWMQMFGYAAATVFSIFFLFNDTLRVYFYNESWVYVLVSFGFMIGLNLFGRLGRYVGLLVPMIVVRALALCIFLTSIQLYSEYLIWETIFRDTASLEGPDVTEMEERLQAHHPFPNSWLDLHTDPKNNNLLERTEFTRAFFGSLLGFTLFFPLFCIIIGLIICSGEKHLRPHQVTGHWMQRVGTIAGLLPSIAMFFVNDSLLLAGPRSYNFFQTYPIAVLGLIFGVVSDMMLEYLNG